MSEFAMEVKRISLRVCDLHIRARGVEIVLDYLDRDDRKAIAEELRNAAADLAPSDAQEER